MRITKILDESKDTQAREENTTKKEKGKVEKKQDGRLSSI